jgi:hypothetical protein
MHRTYRVAIAAALVAAAAIATTSASAMPRREQRQQRAGSPVVFLAHTVRLLAANRYSEAWISLNPLQQHVAPFQAYVACESQSPIPGQLVSLRALHVRNEKVEVVPAQPLVASTAVTFALRLAGAAVPGGVRIVLTAHAVAVDSRWTWIMPSARLKLYRQGCGTDPAPTP